MSQDLRRNPSSGPDLKEEEVRVPAHPGTLEADLAVPAGARGVIIFAHGSGSSRRSPRNRAVAEHLRDAGFSTLLLDLLTSEEDEAFSSRFDLKLMTSRLEAATSWIATSERTAGLPVGYFGASTGAAVALLAAAEIGSPVGAVVSRGGRPDLVGPTLAAVKCPTLLIVGSLDEGVLELNRRALELLGCARKELSVVPGASHLFGEEGALQDVAGRAARWFRRYLLKSPGCRST